MFCVGAAALVGSNLKTKGQPIKLCTAATLAVIPLARNFKFERTWWSTGEVFQHRRVQLAKTFICSEINLSIQVIFTSFDA